MSKNNPKQLQPSAFDNTMRISKLRFGIFGITPTISCLSLLTTLTILTSTSTASAITRCEVLRRAQAWVDDPNSWYSWDPTYTDPTTGVCCYRPDCSGLVSAVWGLPPPGNTTYSFAPGPWDNGVSHVIGANELKPGDALNYPGNPNAGTGHIMLYVSGNFNSGSVEVIEEFNYGNTAVRRWRNIDTSIYKPIRYNGIVDGEPEVCNGIDDDCNGLIDDGGVCEYEFLQKGQAWLAPAATTDIDGDGRADVCGRGSSGVWCHLSKGTSWADKGSILPLSDANGWNDPLNWATFRFGDIDGDGRADLCARSDSQVECWKSDGTGLNTNVIGPPWSDENGWGHVQYHNTMRLVDFDGDGKDDLCARAASGIECHKSTGDGFDAKVQGPEWSDAKGFNEPKHYGTLRTGDVNGDGRMDLCMRTQEGMECWLSDGQGFPTRVQGPAWSDENGWGALRYWSTIRLADVNGDGKADLCARDSKALRCHFSKGDSFENAIEVAPLADDQGWDDETNFLTLRTGDIDGNGAQDLCIRSNSAIECYLWNGSTFARVDGPAWSDGDGWNQSKYYDTIQLGDMDGDGKADICARHVQGWRCHLSTGDGFGSPIAVDEFTDEGGWGYPKYYGTILFGGLGCVPSQEICNGKDDDCDGLIDEDGVCDDAGVGATDAQAASDSQGGSNSSAQEGGGNGASGQNSAGAYPQDSATSCACRTHPFERGGRLAWLGIGSVLGFAFLRRNIRAGRVRGHRP